MIIIIVIMIVIVIMIIMIVMIMTNEHDYHLWQTVLFSVSVKPDPVAVSCVTIINAADYHD